MGERCRQSCQDSSWNKGRTVAGCSGELWSNISSMRLGRHSVSSPDETLTMMCSKEVLTNFKVFYLSMKHCVECLIIPLKQHDFGRRN